MATQEAKSENVSQFQAALEEWNKGHSQQGGGAFDPIPVLNKMASLLEQETEEFYKKDPDPLDDRPPGRQITSCGLGQMMKFVFKNEDFMNTIVGTYLLQGPHHNGGPLFTAACRVLLVLLPGLETSVPFREMEGVVERLYHWAEFSEEPLRSYATGLLSGAMELNDMAVKFRDEGMHIVPIMLDRLHALIKDEKAEKEAVAKNLFDKSECSGDRVSGTNDDGKKSPRYFAAIGRDDPSSSHPSKDAGDTKNSLKRSLSPRRSELNSDFHPAKKMRTTSENYFDTEHSNSSWAELRPLVIGTYSLHPLTTSMKERLILQYLTPLGDYHELLKPILEHDAMSLIFYYINLMENKDIRLAFDALRFLSVILCHKKFAAEFIARGGIQKLLEIHRPSIAATGVSLCFYYITYFEDATERMCALPYQVLSDVVSYNLWLMECSHDSSRCHACLFFSQSFHYKVILELFDKKDGLRRLINVISTLSILNVEDQHSQSDDELHQMRQSARLVCGALRHYFEFHTIIKADELRSINHHDGMISTIKETPNYKSLKGAKMSLEENMDVLLECLPPNSTWAPEMQINKLGGLSLLCQLVAMSPEWESFSGKVDTIVYALDVLAMCAVSHRALLLFCGSINLPDNVTTPIMSVLVGLAEGEVISDPDIQKAALRVIINCVSGPIERFGMNLSKHQPTSVKKKGSLEDILSTMWHNLRINNGIMVLLKLLCVKTPIVEADVIRTLACKALVGLSRSETIRQIIGKRPPLNNGQLQSLVKEPILSDKRHIHLLFCKYSSILLEKIAGRQANVLGVATLEEIRRAGVVAQTKIVYQDRELLQLMLEHLVSKGLTESAAALQKEACLPKVSSHHLLHSPSTPKIGRQLSIPQGPSQNATPSTSREIFPPSTPSAQSSTSSSSSSSTTFVPISHRSTTPPPLSDRVSPSSVSTPQSSTNLSRTPVPLGNSTANGPLKFTLNRPHQSQATPPHPKSTKRRFLKEREGYVPLGVSQRQKGKQTGPDFEVTLDKIVTEYLRKQHALCPQPISTCPTMSLFLPHRCPEPLGRNSASLSITSRVFDRQLRPRHGGPNGERLSRRYIYSKLASISTLRDTSGDGLACCAFDSLCDNIFVGSFSGELRYMDNLSDGDDFHTFVCHSSPLINVNTSPVNCDLVFTSTWGASQNSALWSFKRGDPPSFDLKYRFEDNLASLANLSHDRFIGTKDTIASIYDTATGTKTQTLFDERKANNYKFNEATFNPTDELVLNDGNLWDLRSNKMIYKFDKFNQYTSGCFHPCGLEVVINSEIWDIRTFRLVRTVPALDQCQILFNHAGDVIYAIRVDDEMSDSIFSRRDYASTLRTFDATNYSNIGTFDLKTKSIFDLAIDRNDHHIAVVENTAQHESDPEEAFCRIYELGKTREPEDQVEDDDDNGANDDPDYDDNDSDNDSDDDDDDGDFMEIADNTDSDLEVSSPSEGGEFSPGGSSDGANNDDDDDNVDLDDLLFELV